MRVEWEGLVCNPDCLRFAELHLSREEVQGKDVLEVGALNVNGSVRSVVAPLSPRSYLGVDIAPGLGVDEVCDVHGLVRRYGRERFDCVICTEVLEHVRDWRSAIRNLKHVLRARGILLVTTRSVGFGYHAYPHDYWRFEIEDMRGIFSDLNIVALVSDPSAPGVFMKAQRPHPFREARPDAHRLYSVVTCRRSRDLSGTWARLAEVALPVRLRYLPHVPSGFRSTAKRVLGMFSRMQPRTAGARVEGG